MQVFFFILLTVFSQLAMAQGQKVAVVKIMRGTVEVLTMGKTTALKVDKWVNEGDIVKTSDKSFVRLVFVDKSLMNIGPNSEMKIEKFSDKDAGVINLIKGQIRSQVTKDYLQIKDKNASKLFIKSNNAVMGIRGTDFMITTNEKTTSTILFEGEVVFNKSETNNVTDPRQLEDIVDRGVKLHPGEFSVVDQNQVAPTIPSKLNVHQLEKLEKNVTFTHRNPGSSENEEGKKSVVPAGLNGQLVSNESSSLKAVVVQAPAGESSNPNGFVDGDKVKPANGSFIHLESGVIIPPGADSVLDPNTNSFIAGPEAGQVADDGSFVPPKNIEITSDGKILISVTSENGEKKIVEVARPSPVKEEAARGPAFSFPPNPIGTPSAPPKDAPLISPNDPANRNATGGVSNVNDANQQIYNTGPHIRTIDVIR